MIKFLVRFFNTDGLLKDSSVLFVGMAGAHVLNLLFQIVMGRNLEPAEYAMLVTLLGIFNIFSMPLTVIGSSINRYSSLLVREGRRGDVQRLVVRWSGRLLLIGLILSAFCFAFPSQISGFFHLERTAPILIFGIILAGLFCRPVFDGALMGLQCFGGWCFSSLFGWGTRLFVGATFVLCVSPYAGWGLLGHGLGFYAAVLAGLFIVRRQLAGGVVTDMELPKMQEYMICSFLVLLGYSFLMTGDVVLVKHLYPENAGDFSYAATLGRLVIFIPQAFVAAMFPKVVSEGISTRAHRTIYYKTLFMTFSATVLSALVFTFAVRLMLKLIYGISEPSDNLVLWSRMLAWIMVPVALLSVSVRFALAQKLFKLSFVVFLSSCTYLVCAILFSRSVDAVLYMVGVLAVFALAMLFFGIVRTAVSPDDSGGFANMGCERG